MSIAWSRRPITSWGRVSRGMQTTTRPRFRDALPECLAPNGAVSGTSALPLGLARSYGDSCLNSRGRLVDMTALDRVIDFDAGSGLFRAEAGLSLSAVLSLVVPRGYFLPTTAGNAFRHPGRRRGQ